MTNQVGVWHENGLPAGGLRPFTLQKAAFCAVKGRLLQW